MAYSAELWYALFTMMGGAAAALAGLIFVAVSLNHEQILKAPSLPPLAAQTLSILISLVLLCAVGLTPGQTRVAVGAEILAVGIVLAIIVIGSTFRRPSKAAKLRWQASRLGLGTAATLPTLIGGATLIAGSGGGFYWLLIEFVAGIMVAAYYAWILLIEIRR